MINCAARRKLICPSDVVNFVQLNITQYFLFSFCIFLPCYSSWMQKIMWHKIKVREKTDIQS